MSNNVLVNNSFFLFCKVKNMLTTGLYIISTPIGNLKDISQRALEVLEQAPVIACEDTRVSKKLFSLLNLSLKKKFITYQDHNEEEQSQKIIDIIQNEGAVALISDAGSPLISDPGYKLVKKCREQGVFVSAIPGACALITALQLSGLPTNRFMFAGFIPNKDKARTDLFNELKDIDSTLVFYETAPRIVKTLETAGQIFKNRAIAVARELTKMYEEVLSDSAENLRVHFEKNPPKGEFVFMVAPPEKSAEPKENIEEILRKKMKQTTLKTAVKEVADEYKLNKSQVYALALRLKDE